MSLHNQDFLDGGGETGACLRALDWSQSSLGKPEHWPLSLRILMRHMLASGFPMFIAWGPKLSFLYNDGYASLLGARHPQAMARPFQEIWSDVWDVVSPIVERALRGNSTYGENRPLTVRRNGYDEQAWFTFSYSPAYGDDGKVAGMYCVCTETTAHVLTQESLQQLTESLESEVATRTAERDRIWKISKDILTIASLDGRVTRVNPAATAILGWSTEELTSMSFLELAHPEHKKRFEESIGHLANGEAALNVDVRINHKDGTYRWLSWTIVPEDNQLYAVARDITELKRKQRKLQEVSEARLQLALEAGQMGAWEWDAEKRKATWWPGMERIHGIASADIPHSLEGYAKLIHPADMTQVISIVRDSIVRNQPYQVEYRVVRPDGTMCWVEGRGEAFYDEDGVPFRFAGICMDITARKKVEQDLLFLARASEELAALVDYRTTLNKVAQLCVPHFADWCAVDMLDNHGTLRRVAVAHVNPEQVEQAYELFAKYPPDSSKDTGTWGVIRSSKPELVPEITEQMLEVSINDQDYLAAIKALGLRSYMGVPLCRRGKAFGVISFIGAESNRRYSEQDLELASELGRRAAIAIENTSLYHALQEADEAKDRFIATLAHELRTPLAAIAAVPELVRHTDGDINTTMSSMDVIERQVEKLSRQVEDLLDISRITAGKVDLRKEHVSLAGIVSQAIETSRVYIESANHALDVRLSEGPTDIFADSLRLEQVFVNILNNAAKFTSAGGHIQVTMESNVHGHITRIKDNGIGISDDMMKNVFNMYMQEKSASQGRSGGLGIGLALVRKLVELHGGHVEARSAGIGQGSEFIVYIPRALV